jgi:hypothetical protein
MPTSPSRTSNWCFRLAVPALLGTWAVTAPAADLPRKTRAAEAASPPAARPAEAQAVRKPSDAPPVFKTYRVPAGSAEAVARTLQDVFKPSPERRIAAVNDHSILVYAPPDDQSVIARRLHGDGAARPRRDRPAATRLAHQPAGAGNATADKAGKAAPPVVITAFGDKLLVSSEDPEALAAVERLSRLLTHTPSGVEDYQVIQLKNTTASDAAKVLEEAFNGPAQVAPPQQQRRGGFFGRLAAALSAPAPAATEDRIRVVPDPDTNTLLVRASPLDMMTVRRLLANDIDRADSGPGGAIRTWVIGPLRNTQADDVAGVLAQVYREYTNNNPTTVTRGRPRNRNIGPDGKPRAVTLSIGVDERSNSVVVACPNAMHEDIVRLVEQMETSGNGSPGTVAVVPLKGVDPAVVQEAIDAMEGRRTTRPASAPSPAPSLGGLGGLMRAFGGMRPSGGGRPAGR